MPLASKCGLNSTWLYVEPSYHLTHALIVCPCLFGRGEFKFLKPHHCKLDIFVGVPFSELQHVQRFVWNEFQHPSRFPRADISWPNPPHLFPWQPLICSQLFPIVLSLGLLAVLSLKMPWFLRMLYKWNHAVGNLWRLASFSLRGFFGIHLCVECIDSLSLRTMLLDSLRVGTRFKGGCSD